MIKLSENAQRWGILGVVILGTFMAILDSSIVNVALPRMMSTFSLGREEIAWVTNGFMLTSAVTMPAVGWLVGRLGHRTLYLWSMALFTVGSAACALAWSYDALIAARVLQAIGAGVMQPAGMAIVASLFEPHERGKALGIWGTGVMVGPALGPTVGGYLTEAYGWRTIFSINLPFGIVALAMGAALMKAERFPKEKPVPFDWWGFIFLSLALVGGLLAFADGQEKGWTSTYILVCITAAVVGLVMFIAVESTVEHPLLDLKLLRISNYTISMILAVFRAVGLFGGLFLLPIFLQSVVGYTPIQAGIWMMPSALTVGLVMPIAGRMADKYPARWLVIFGTLLTGYSSFMYGNLDPLSSRLSIIGPQIIRGIGIAFMMSPMMTAAINAVPQAQIPMASAFLNVSQRFGGSFGIAMLNTFVSNSIVKHAARIGEMVGAQSETFIKFSQHAMYGLLRASHGMSGADSTREAMVSSALRSLPGQALAEHTTGAMLAFQQIMLKASVLGFDNAFVLAGIVVLSGVPLCFFIKTQVHEDQLGGGGPGRMGPM